MMRFKDFSDGACMVQDCLEESEKIWAGTESDIVDVCLKHYKELTGI